MMLSCSLAKSTSYRKRGSWLFLLTLTPGEKKKRHDGPQTLKRYPVWGEKAVSQMKIAVFLTRSVSYTIVGPIYKSIAQRLGCRVFPSLAGNTARSCHVRRTGASVANSTFWQNRTASEQCGIGTALFWQAAVGNGVNSNDNTFKGIQRQQTLPEAELA